MFPAQREQLAHAGACDERQHDDLAELWRRRFEQSPLFVWRENTCPLVIDLQPLDAGGRRLQKRPPLDGLRQNRFQGVEFPVDRRRLERVRRALLPMRSPLAGEPFAFELFDPVRRDLVQDERPECPVERLENLAIAVCVFLCRSA